MYYVMCDTGGLNKVRTGNGLSGSGYTGDSAFGSYRCYLYYGVICTSLHRWRQPHIYAFYKDPVYMESPV